MAEQSDRLIQKLINQLNNEDPVVRRNAVGALRLHGRRAAAAVPSLIRLLTDEDPLVQDEVRRALDRLRDAAA